MYSYNLTIYRPFNTVTLMSFTELPVFSPVPWASGYRCEKYKGCFGTESGVNSFSNMNTTDDMSGLLFGLSCTHNSPMWMHRKASVGEQVSRRDESTSLKALYSTLTHSEFATLFKGTVIANQCSSLNKILFPCDVGEDLVVALASPGWSNDDTEM